MRSVLVAVFLFSYCAFSQTQNEFNAWLEVGASGKITKGLKWAGSLNSRFDDRGMKTFFPELGIDYKLTDWLRPGIEYRFITELNDYGNYKPSSSIRFNLSFRGEVDRFKLGARLRYQNSFDHSGATGYNDDFDQAIRFKPSVEYNIKGVKFTPNFSAEFYYNPEYGERTPSFTKIRYALGVSYKVKKDHELGVKYRIDQRLNRYPIRLRHIVSLAYSYSL